MNFLIIPAAGKSSRFYELGRQYAKCVLPYNGKPIIEHIIEGMYDAKAIDRTVVVVNNAYHKGQIKEAIAPLVDNGFEIEVLQIDDSIGSLNPGPGKTVMMAVESLYDRGLLDNEDDVIVHLSDSLFDYDLVATELQPWSISSQLVEDQARWCIAVPDTGEMYDKPTKPIEGGLALSGLYRFQYDPLALKRVAATPGEYQLSTFLRSLGHPFDLVGIPIDKDFGTLEEYNRHRGINKARSFNKLEEKEYGVVKTSESNPKKIVDEGNWFHDLPMILKHYTPAIYSKRNSEVLVMEKINSINLRDMCLFLDRSKETWKPIFASVKHMLSNFDTCERGHNDLSWVYEKTESRLKSSLNLVDLDTRSLRNFMDRLKKVCEKKRSTELMHGDLHFANMFWDPVNAQLKVIDPMGGYRSGKNSRLYDLAKLEHSVYGYYDWIDGELYSFNGPKFYDAGREGIQQAYEEEIGKHLDPETRADIRILTASLFLSMIPLHSHNTRNQRMFYNEFLRLSK